MKSAPALVGLFLASLVLRVWAIAVPLNADEAKWLSRGVLFYNGLLSGNLAETYQSPHPGIPNMWLSGLGMSINCQLSHGFPTLFAVDQPSALGACTDTLPFAVGLYVLPRLIQAIVTSACMVALYLLMTRLLGRAIALVAIVLLTLEPFFLGYQRFVTTDALHADFGILSLLLFLLYLRGGRDRPHRRMLLLSGGLMGLSVAAKIISLFMLPAVAGWVVLTELGVWSSQFPKMGWRSRLKELGVWFATLLVTLFVLCPALWLQPGYTLNRWIEGLLEEADRGYFFFMGALTHSPNALFYPVAIAFRLSPVLHLGVGFCLVGLLIPRLRQRIPHRPVLLALGLAALWFLVCLSLSTTKIDRYLSLIIPILSMLAAAGWLSMVQWMKTLPISLPSRLRKLPAEISLAVLLGCAQLAILLPHVPYYLTYFNPLLGGTTAAQNVLMVGQGEGLDRAAAWMNQLPDVQATTAASWHRSVFAAYSKAQVGLIPQDELPDRDFWNQTNYVVFYQNQRQRQLPSQAFIDYFAVQPVLHTVVVDGVPYVQIYPGPVLRPEAVTAIQYPVSVTVSDRLQLLGYDVYRSPETDEPVLALYWTVLRRLPPDLQLEIELRDAQGQVVLNTTEPLLGGLSPIQHVRPDTLLRDVHPLAIAPDALSVKYDLYLAWRSAQTREISPITNQEEVRVEAPVLLGTFELPETP